MSTFKAFRLHAGDPEPVRRIVEMDVGDLSPGNVVIQVAYSSINYKENLEPPLEGPEAAWANSLLGKTDSRP